MHEWPSLPVDFRIVMKDLLHLWRRSTPFEHCTCHKLEYLDPYERVKFYLFTETARVSRYVPLPSMWACIEVAIRFAALLPSMVSYLGSRLWEDANSKSWVFMYTGWAALCVRDLLKDAFEYQKLWYFPPVVFKMINSLGMFVLPGGQRNADEPIRLFSMVECIDWSTVPIANSCRPKRWRRSSPHFPRQLKKAGDFVAYDPDSRDIFVTEVCLAREIKLLAQPSSLRPDSTILKRSSNERQELPAVLTLNTLARVLARPFWIITVDRPNDIVDAPRFIHSSAI